MFRQDPRAVVLYLYDNVASVSKVFFITHARFKIGGMYVNISPFGHGLLGVEYNIVNDLIYLSFVNFGEPEIFINIKTGFDV